MPNPKFRKTVAKAMIKKRGSTAIAKLPQKKKLFTNPNRIQDAKLKERFDKEKSWIQNLKTTNLKEMYSEQLPETIPDKAAWTVPKLSEDEATTVRRLVQVHGEINFRKMAFDRKLNIYQWTEDQCQNKVKMLLVDKRFHVCEDGKCLCGCTPNSSYVAKKDRIRK
jgi:hypothetical protein